MKNKKSPLKFGSVATTAAGALGTQNLIGRLGGLFGRGRGNMSRHTGVGGLGEQYAGVGSRPANVVDAGAQFDPTAMQHMQGMFGDISGRQATLGASGIFALEKHLSPVNNDTPMSESEKKLMHATASVNDKYAVDLGTVKSKKSDLTAYKSPNPPFDPTSEDDGAGGKEYDTN
tara:strand:+ start:2539 stop:3060 length:522 start_codon:yes stop_codon:yes gene_type:complete